MEGMDGEIKRRYRVYERPRRNVRPTRQSKTCKHLMREPGFDRSGTGCKMGR